MTIDGNPAITTDDGNGGLAFYYVSHNGITYWISFENTLQSDVDTVIQSIKFTN